MKIARFIVLFLFFSIVSEINAATIVVGSGTNINTGATYPAPYGNYFWGAKHQFLITASELTGAGMTAGNINSLSFVVDQANGTSLQGFTIAMKNTPTTNLTVFETGLTNVLTPAAYTEVNGINTHTLTSPFYWDGISSLLVQTCFNNSAWTQNATIFYTTTSYASTVYYRQDASGVCSSNITTASVNNRPNMIFDWTGANIPPVSNFIANSNNTCSGIINFLDLSTNNPISWNWNFGDGDTSTAQNPSHTYLASGTYSVTLIACNAFGCDTTVFNNYIVVNLSAPTPVPATCTPNTLTYCCGFGITNVTFNTINNTTNDGVDGYSDFTCTQTNVLEGQTYLLSIQTVASSTQNYAAWIDFNNDGILDDVTERIFTSSSQMNTSGNITIPAGAVLNTPLRLRVSADYDFSAAPTSCADLDFGQAEDYTVIINSNPSPPIPVFSASPTTTCDGMVCFTDQSLNVPTGWLWNFGDGNTSFQQSPCYTYAADGVYTVTLTVTNVNGGNVDSIVNYITVNTAGQVVASCSPATSAYCCGYGIYQVDFNTISNLTTDAIEGYQDFSCTNSTTVTEGNIYTLTISTGISNPQDTRAWIDFNNDGTFNNVNELILDVSSTFNPTLNILIPGGAIINTPLRMRISSDVVGVTQSACDANDFGQTEDYGIIIQSNSLPPVSNFIASATTTCSDTICFTDISSGTPTSWLWYFGDGNTSNLQNPCHYYVNTGLYTVSLVITNAFGQDSVAFSNYIDINCANINMPLNGTETYTACLGTLRDNGGNGNYSNNTDGIVVLQPTGATQINLSFLFFDFVASNPGDTLFIYDGPSELSPLIVFYTGNANPSSINSTGGSITVRQKTNNFATDPGFELVWSCTVGVGESENYSDNFIVYPNPTKEVIKIRSTNTKKLNINEIKLYNAFGQVVFQNIILDDNDIIEINVSSLPKGLYFLNILNDEGMATKKINVQ